ncbi:MAG: ADP-ribosyl-[dinitrogen reductase] glycohydrolase [Anaerolineae bacterium]|nr:ADP-ribosyl-[dinitrogen reductase] glycohydrolase [Anaerolineae bacterium]
MTTAQFDRFAGALLGLAVADAVGTTLEFKSPGSFTPISDMVGGGPFGLQPGQWTDDTSMALCLAASLVETQTFDLRDQMERYVRWRHDGYMSSTGVCFDIGNTVAGALRRYRQTGDPLAGSTDPHTAGNGSIMRLAPVPMTYHRAPARAIELSGESSKTTHGAPAAVDACRFLGGLLVGAINGAARDELLSPGYGPIPGCWADFPLQPKIAVIAGGSYKSKNPPEIRGTGYVVDSLEAALWAFYHARDFRDGCLKAANLGNDADTTAAVYGQIAGAYFGASNIPAEWLQKLALRETIDLLIDRLYRLARQ